MIIFIKDNIYILATIYWPAVARGAAGAPYSSRLTLLQTLHQYTSWHTSSHCGCGTSLHSLTVMSSHSVLSVGTHTCTRHVTVTRVTARAKELQTKVR